MIELETVRWRVDDAQGLVSKAFMMYVESHFVLLLVKHKLVPFCWDTLQVRARPLLDGLTFAIGLSRVTAS